MQNIQLLETRKLPRDQVLELYTANKWSSAGKPDKLMHHLTTSHALVSAWDGSKLVGLGNTLSDGQLVAYYSHLLVLPEYQGRGIGAAIIRQLMTRYADFHQQVLLGAGEAVGFYCKLGFERAGDTEPMWIFRGNEH